MDGMDEFSLLELDQWLLSVPTALPVEDAALVRVQGDEIPQQLTPTALHDAEAANASDCRRPEPCQVLTKLQRLEDREHADQPPPKKAKRGKSSSQRQKEQIALLRQQAAELQALAARLRGMDTALTSDGSSASMTINTADTHSMWLNVAKRQQDEEKRVKETNAKLRGALVTHAKFVQRLDRVLRKAADWSVGTLPAQAGWLASTPSRENRAIFVSLARSVEEQVLPQFDDMMGRRWHLLPCGDADHDRDYQNALGDRVAEAKNTTLLPFSHRMVDEVSWRSMRNGTLQFGLRADATITLAEDMLACQISVRSAFMKSKNKSESEVPGMKTYLVLKRCQQVDRVVYGWETLTFLPVVEDPLAQPVQIIGRGWSEIAPRRMRNGTEGCATRSYTQWQVRWRRKERADLVTARIVKTLMKEHDQSHVKINQSLENLLLDEAVRIRKRAR